MCFNMCWEPAEGWGLKFSHANNKSVSLARGSKPVWHTRTHLFLSIFQFRVHSDKADSFYFWQILSSSHWQWDVLLMWHVQCFNDFFLVALNQVLLSGYREVKHCNVGVLLRGKLFVNQFIYFLKACFDIIINQSVWRYLCSVNCRLLEKTSKDQGCCQKASGMCACHKWSHLDFSSSCRSTQGVFMWVVLSVFLHTGSFVTEHFIILVIVMIHL